VDYFSSAKWAAEPRPITEAGHRGSQRAFDRYYCFYCTAPFGLGRHSDFAIFAIRASDIAGIC